ncbi:hypothetical protein AcW1_002209 [Taiwanofungus camphoratus]|nr:hypothetical protein AcV5_010203 [Antrodia cinnamomea]KAI0944527.1 hypothetical protein AcW1_002209 [Antrodia cinnamomea]KAI0946186.1 hypothetical protein AcV7_010223 [Antrodia cinnamomea]
MSEGCYGRNFTDYRAPGRQITALLTFSGLVSDSTRIFGGTAIRSSVVLSSSPFDRPSPMIAVIGTNLRTTACRVTFPSMLFGAQNPSRIILISSAQVGP